MRVIKQDELLGFSRDDINVLLNKTVRIENNKGDIYVGTIVRIECSPYREQWPTHIVIGGKRIIITDIQTIQFKD